MPRDFNGPRNAWFAALLAGAVVALAAATPVRAQQAGRLLSRYAPEQGRLLYAEFQGFDSHAAGWRKTALYKLLNTTRFGALLEDLAAQAIEGAREDKPGNRLSGRETVALLKRVAQKGCLVVSYGKPPAVDGLFVFRDGTDPALRPALEAFAASLAPKGADRRTIEKAGRTFIQWGQGRGGSTLWTEGNDVLVTESPALDRILDRLKAGARGAQPGGTTRPEPGFEPVFAAQIDLAVLGKVPPDAAALGLDGLKRVDVQWGFQDDALKSVVRLTAPAPRRGILALLDQPGFAKVSLPVLPAGLNGFVVFSLDPATTFDRIVSLMKTANAGQAEKLDEGERALSQALGVDLRKELLAHLGPNWSVYRGGAAGQPGPIAMLNTTVIVAIDDQAAVARALGPVMAVLEKVAQGQVAPGAEAPRIQKLDGPNPTFTLQLPAGMLPPGPLSALAPTVIVGKRQLILSARRDAAEAALTLLEKNEPRWKATEAFVPMMRQLPGKMVLLTVSDPRTTLPDLIASLPQLLPAMKQAAAQAAARAPGGGNGRAAADFPIEIDPALVPRADEIRPLLFPSSFAVTADDQEITLVARDSVPSLTSPGTAGVAVALLLPAVQAAREAARRTQCVNNLKQIGLGLDAFHAAHGAFPRRAVTDRNGKPLLSWRVTILPFIGYDDLYDKFKLDEPWDSPHNRALIESMPATYACPSRPRTEPNLTPYRAFGGPLSLMQVDRDVAVKDVTDGLSNTLAVVEAAQPVPWTKPDDLPLDPDQTAPLLGAGSSHAGGFNALFADGTVRFLKPAIGLKVLNALITRAGGEAIPAGAY